MKNRTFLVVIISLASIAFFSLTNPASVPVGLLMVPILLAFAVSASLALLLIHWLKVLEGQQRKQRGVAVLIGSMAALYIVFQSTGGLALADIILLGLIFLISYLYITKY